MSRRPQSSSSHNEVRTEEDKERANRRALDILFEMSTLLNTGLTQEMLEVSVALLEDGTNPTALAQVIKELRAEAAKKGNQK